MSDQIAVCLVIHNNYWVTRYTIENLLEKTNCDLRLYIIDNGSTDERVSSFCKSLCGGQKGYYKYLNEKTGYSKAINEAIRIVTQKYCVIFPVNYLVNNNWLEDLIHNQMVIQSCGCTAIRNGFEKLHWMPLLHFCDSMPEDELRNILISENNSVEGLLMFDKEKISFIGLFDENLQNKGFEQAEFCFRIASLGLNNFYIRKQTAVKIQLDDEVLFPKKTKEGMDEFKMNVEWMIKNQMFKK